MRILLAVLVFASLPCRAGELLVFAASSTADVLEQLGREFQAKTGEKVLYSFAASSTLSRQIEAGAPADVFLSADSATMDRVEEAGLLVPGTRKPLLGNRLVVVMPREKATAIADARGLLKVRRLALADPAAVPAGVYAKGWLTAAGVWEQLKDRVLPTLDVRAALAAVETGSADAAVVYQSEALRSSKLALVYRVPLERTPPIHYFVARLTHSRGGPAESFLRFLRSPHARALFTRGGFSMMGER